jgi:hypothetical protein
MKGTRLTCVINLEKITGHSGESICNEIEKRDGGRCRQ